jgi:hypothetical protein
MVYHNPKEVEGTPARILVEVDTNNTISKSPDFDQWVEDNRDKIASAIIKTIRNKTVSRYKCLRIKGVPFYKSL